MSVETSILISQARWWQTRSAGGREGCEYPGQGEPPKGPKMLRSHTTQSGLCWLWKRQEGRGERPITPVPRAHRAHATAGPATTTTPAPLQGLPDPPPSFLISPDASPFPPNSRTHILNTETWSIFSAQITALLLHSEQSVMVSPSFHDGIPATCPSRFLVLCPLLLPRWCPSSRMNAPNMLPQRGEVFPLALASARHALSPGPQSLLKGPLSACLL